MLAVFHATATMLWVAVNTLYDPIWHVSSRGGEECCGLLYIHRLPNYLTAAPWWLGNRVVSVLDSGAEGPSNRSRDTVG